MVKREKEKEKMRDKSIFKKSYLQKAVKYSV